MSRNNLIFALFLISLGGFLLHLRVHPPLEAGKLEWENLLPFIANIFSLSLVILLFLKKETADSGYLLNGLTVILGVILMSHLSLENLHKDFSFRWLFLGTTLGDSLILFGKFMVGKALFEFYYPERSARNWKYPTGFRYLYNGWWLLHFILITLVYTLGNLLFNRG